jgi:predicted O-methyltransferase YrrM
MNRDQWTAVDAYLTDSLLPPDPVLDAVLAASDAAGLPQIAVSPNQGKLLQILAQVQGARRILEVGTLGGYSTIWLARALPADGRLVTLEYDPKHAQVARANIAAAGFASQVEVVVGKAADTLPGVAAAADGPFDLVFIDADKPSNPIYFDWALKLSRPGGVIVVDNVVRAGAVTDPAGGADVQGVRKLFEKIAAEPRVSATALQTVGSKGWDGLAVVRVER